MTVEFKGTFDTRQAQQAIDKLVGKVNALEGKLKTTTKVSSRLTREQRELGREAMRAFDSTRTPSERHTARLKKLRMILKDTSGTHEAYGRRARQAYARMIAGADRAGQAAQQAGGTMMGAFGARAFGQLTAFAGGLMSIRAILGKIKQGFDEIDQAKDEAVQLRRDAKFAFGRLMQLPGTPEDKKAREEEAIEMVGRGVTSAN